VARKIFDARSKRLAIQYDKSLSSGSSPSNLIKNEALDKLDALIEEEGAAVEINREISSTAKLDISLLPSLHGIMSNTYSVIDNEIRRLQRTSSAEGLAPAQSKHLAVLTRSLCQLANLELGIREQSNLDYLPDEQLMNEADRAFKRLKSNVDLTKDMGPKV